MIYLGSKKGIELYQQGSVKGRLWCIDPDTDTWRIEVEEDHPRARWGYSRVDYPEKREAWRELWHKLQRLSDEHDEI